MTGLLGGIEGESEFSLEDLYADVDAVNLYNMIIVISFIGLYLKKTSAIMSKANAKLQEMHL